MIVCFGEALVDLYGIPLGASVEEASSFLPRLGGAPANVAIALGRMGIGARFVGAVGRDGHGERLVAGMRAAGVDVGCVARRAERTGVTFVRVSEGGARSFLFYRGGGADYALDLDDLRGGRDPLEGARWILFGSSAFVAEPLARAARWLLDQALARGVAVVSDLNVRPHLWRDPDALRAAVDALLDASRVVKASDDDLRALGLDDTVDALCGRVRGDALAVVTRGARGWAAGMGARRWRGEAAHAEEVDATGAGDAFVAGLLAGLPRPSALDDPGRVEVALGAASALGARAVMAIGATDALTSPWPEAVTRALDAREAER